MQQLVPVVLQNMPAAAIPVVIVVLGLYWINRKTKRIEIDRATTKSYRDEEASRMHDEILALKFKVTTLEGIATLHRDKLYSIDKQLNLVNQELVKLNMTVGHLAEALERQNQIMLKSLDNKNAGE